MYYTGKAIARQTGASARLETDSQNRVSEHQMVANYKDLGRLATGGIDLDPFCLIWRVWQDRRTERNGTERSGVECSEVRRSEPSGVGCCWRSGGGGPEARSRSGDSSIPRSVTRQITDKTGPNKSRREAKRPKSVLPCFSRPYGRLHCEFLTHS